MKNRKDSSVYVQAINRLKEETPHSDLPITSGVMTVTPALAEDWLRRNRINRKIVGTNIERFRRQIEEGRWCINGETISFSSLGNLMNGQHRLYACVLAGRPIDAIVVFGLDESTFDTIDTGRVRQAVDVLWRAELPYPQALGAAVRWEMLYRDGTISPRMHSAFSGSLTSNQEIVEFAKANPDLCDAAAGAQSDRRLVNLTSPSIAVFFSWHVRRAGGATGDAFLEALKAGEALRSGDPIYHLRERLIRESTQAKKHQSAFILALCIKAWNAHIEGRTVSRISFDASKEDYPRFIERPATVQQQQAA